jgi:hypothetical protein
VGYHLTLSHVGKGIIMQPTRALWRRGPDLLSADATTLAPAVNACEVHLAMNAFTPGLDLEIGDLTEATFTGSAAKAVGLGAQPIYYDSADNLLTIRLLEPVGGWNWTCTVAPGAPETIYGVYVTDDTGAILFGAQLLENPVTIDDAGQGLGVGDITLKFLENSPF